MDRLLKIRTYKKWGYQLRYWLIDGTKWGSSNFEITKAYTWPEGYYIGDSKRAYRLCVKRGIVPRPIELPEPKTESLPHQEAKNLLLEHGEIDKHEPICSIGYCKKQRKWYGWSHRAMFGFTIGSKVKKGDCAYFPSNPQDLLEDLLHFYDSDKPGHKVIFSSHNMRYGDTDEYKQRLHQARVAARRTDLSSMTDLPTVQIGRPTTFLKRKNEIGIYFKMEELYKDGSTKLIEHFEPYPEKWGRGEWKAKTMEEAQQMAIDFAWGVA
jgi:hypothetical protein